MLSTTYVVNTVVDELNGTGDLSLREAIELANANPGADRIEFAAALNGATLQLADIDTGTAANGTLRDNDADLDVTDSVTIDASMLSQGLTIRAAPGADPHPTFLPFENLDETVDYGGGHRVIEVRQTVAANSPEEVNNVTLVGLTITGGNLGFGQEGGGVLSSGVNVTIRSSHFEDNFSGRGGALAFQPAAVAYGPPGQVAGDLVVEDTVFTQNWADSVGGAVYVWNLGDGTLASFEGVTMDNNAVGTVDSEFFGEAAQTGPAWGGSLYVGSLWGSQTVIRNSTISNSSAATGGGVYFDGGSDILINPPGESGDLLIEGSSIHSNTADLSLGALLYSGGLDDGGGVFIRMFGDATHVADAVIRDTAIYNNTAGNSGGGVSYQSDGSSRLSMYNTTISGNTGESQGGGMVLSRDFSSDDTVSDVVTLQNVTVTQNTALSEAALGIPGGGGGILIGGFNSPGIPASRKFADEIVIRDSIIAGNTHVLKSPPNANDIWNLAPDIGGGRPTEFLFDGSPRPAYNLPLNVSYSLIGNTEGPIANGDFPLSGVGNTIDVISTTNTVADLSTYIDPTLAPNGGPTLTHRLVSGSPLIDAGTPGLTPQAPLVDVDGVAILTDQRGAPYGRYASAGGGVGRIDIGAYESGYGPFTYLVSTTDDEVDGDHSFGDLSLREAVQLANAAGGPATILLPEGKYSITATGPELGDASANDLDITGDVTIVGDGAGVSVIDAGSFTNLDAVFEVSGVGRSLALEGLTIANGAYRPLTVAQGGSLRVSDAAIVNVVTAENGAGIQADNPEEVVVERSVFTNLHTTDYEGAAIEFRTSARSPHGRRLSIEDSVFADNLQSNQATTAIATTENVVVVGPATLTNGGGNLYDDAAGGFFDTTPGVGDYLGTPDYVVTTIADTFDHTDDAYVLSVREAVDLANQAAGSDEIWLAPWVFTLTRDRLTYGGGSATDTDVAFGDLDVSDDLIVRSAGLGAHVEWKAGVVDSVFELLGDADQDGLASQGVNATDLSQYGSQHGTGSGTEADWEAYSADFDDDGDVDDDDGAVLTAHWGNTLSLLGVTG